MSVVVVKFITRFTVFRLAERGRDSAMKMKNNFFFLNFEISCIYHVATHLTNNTVEKVDRRISQ